MREISFHTQRIKRHVKNFLSIFIFEILYIFFYIAMRIGFYQAKKISIILPNYNHARFLRNNLDGVVAQHYKNWEMIIVDDGSTDKSAELIFEYSKRDMRIKPIILDKNGGTENAIKVAMENISGDYLYGSASDDFVVNRHFFSRAILAFIIYDIAVYFSRAKMIDGNSDSFRAKMGGSKIHGYIKPNEALELFRNSRIFIPGSSAIIDKNLISLLGGYDSDLGPQSDFFLNHLAAITGGAFYCPIIDITVRIFHNSFSMSSGNILYFERHARVESKIREYLSIADEAGNSFINWRQNIIRKRLDYDKNSVNITKALGFINDVSLSNWPPSDDPRRKHLELIEAELKRLLDQLENEYLLYLSSFDDSVKKFRDHKGRRN